jgi:anti-sigma factor RsiW
MEDLVTVRDGEASAGVRRHLEDCAACRAELDALYQRVAQLKALPALRPPRDRWEVVRAEVVAAQRRRRGVWGTLSLAAAAGLAGLIVFGPWSGGNTLHAELSQAKQRCSRLESALQQYDADGRVVSGRSAALAAQLEDQIAVVDGRLSQLGPGGGRRTPESELVDLWNERATLMQQLYQVRVTRVSYVGL